MYSKAYNLPSPQRANIYIYILTLRIANCQKTVRSLPTPLFAGSIGSIIVCGSKRILWVCIYIYLYSYAKYTVPQEIQRYPKNMRSIFAIYQKTYLDDFIWCCFIFFLPSDWTALKECSPHKISHVRWAMWVWTWGIPSTCLVKLMIIHWVFRYPIFRQAMSAIELRSPRTLGRWGKRLFHQLLSSHPTLNLGCRNARNGSSHVNTGRLKGQNVVNTLYNKPFPKSP